MLLRNVDIMEDGSVDEESENIQKTDSYGISYSLGYYNFLVHSD